MKHPFSKSTMFTQRITAINVALLFLTICISCSEVREKENSGESRQPNIVFILADDLGYNEVGFNRGGSSLTPNIDALRNSGLSLTQFYVHAVCGPSRAAFLTGRYPFRNWTDWRTEDFGKPSYLEMLGMKLSVNDEGDETRRIHALATEERTIAEALSEAGYFTSIIGKWGCGEWLDEHLPMAQGFQHQYGHYAWGIDYNNYSIPHNAPARFAVYDWHRNQQPLYENGYSTDLIANESVRIISERAVKDPDQPFFLYIPFNAVHGPLEDIPRYKNETKRIAAIKCLDDGVGQITGALRQYGLADETIVIFTNDNGAIRDSMNFPYRGTKNTNYEGGVRVPCIVSWPGVVQPGSSCDGMIHITDFYPTLISMAGGSHDQELSIDGYDMSQLLLKPETPSPRNEIIFEVGGSVRPPAIRQGPFKLIGGELYNVVDDPGEMANLADINQDILQELSERVATVGAQRPPMPNMDLLMTPALPWIYGEEENMNVPQWVKDRVTAIRELQPKEWPDGKTPWPQAPKDGKITYTGDGR